MLWQSGSLFQEHRWCSEDKSAPWFKVCLFPLENTSVEKNECKVQLVFFGLFSPSLGWNDQSAFCTVCIIGGSLFAGGYMHTNTCTQIHALKWTKIIPFLVLQATCQRNVVPFLSISLSLSLPLSLSGWVDQSEDRRSSTILLPLLLQNKVLICK